MMHRVRLWFLLSLVALIWLLTVAASGPIDTQLLQLFTIALAVLSPLALKYAPASWKGFPMLVVAVTVSSALAVVNMYIGGQFDHFSIANLAMYLSAFAGAQQIFYAAFKDAWHLN